MSMMEGSRRSQPPPDQPPPKKKRRTQPTLTVTSGVRSDAVKFQWKIENFAAIRHCKQKLQAQQFTIALGASVGAPCKWTFSLNSESELNPAGGPPPPPPPPGGVGGANPVVNNGPQVVEWLEIMRKLVEVPTEGGDVCNSCSLKIKDKDKKTFFKGYGNVNNLKINGYRTFKKVLRIADKSSDLPLIDGALVIDFTVTTFGPRPVVMENLAAMSDFSKEATSKLTEDLTRLLEGPPEATYSDIKITSKDGRVFNVHRNILAGRNAVFEAMFASNLSEHQSGMISVKDLSGRALEILLKYIYGSVVQEEWFQPDVIVELTYAAGKYQLTEVLKYLDSALGTRCMPNNAGALLALAEKLNLKKAEVALMNYVKNIAIPAATSYADLAAVIGVDSGGLADGLD